MLKNAIDSASRPYTDKVFNGKPVAIMSASSGRMGGARVQYHLRQSFVFLNMYPVNYPEIMLPQAQQHIDQDGKLTNEDTRKLIGQLLEELVILTRKLQHKP